MDDYPTSRLSASTPVTGGETSHKLLAAVEKMPAFPRSVQRILELSRSVTCTPKELVSVIEQDPVMTFKVLKVMNSAYYGLPRKITSVSQCVIYLGFNTIKNLALGLAAHGMLPKRNKAGYDVQQYLLHSLVTATLARQLYLRLNAGEPGATDCYIAGLLHDFGKVVFAQFMPDEFREALAISRQEAIPLYVAEQRVLGADHTVVGSILAERWQFAQPLIQSIRNHHVPEPDIEDGAVHACLYLANQIVKTARIGDSGNACVDDIPLAMLQRFRVSELEQLFPSPDELSRIVEEAHSVSHAEGPR